MIEGNNSKKTLLKIDSEEKKLETKIYFLDYLEATNSSKNLFDNIKEEINSSQQKANRFYQKKSFVICLDIRNSTKLMFMAHQNPDKYITFIKNLIDKYREYVTNNNGIWDKFTGDGILFYLPMFKKEKQKAIKKILELSKKFHDIFTEEYKKELKDNLFAVDLKDIGIGIGIDYGLVNYSVENNNLYAMGFPIIYACRLSCAPAYHTYYNVNALNQIINEFENNVPLKSLLKKFILPKEISIKGEEGKIQIYYSSYPRNTSPF